MINGIAKLKTVIESAGGVQPFVTHVLPGILNGDRDNDFKPRMLPEEFSLLEIANATGVDPSLEISEAVNTTQFNVIMNTLLSKKVLSAYTEEPGIIDQLSTPFNSSLKVDTIPGAFLEGDLDDIPEGGPYPHSANIQDKYVEIGWNKRGMILDITKEAIKFDQTGMVMMQAARMGERVKRDREKEGLYTIQEATVNGKTYSAYYPSGSQTALYQNADQTRHLYDNQITNALEDYTDLDAAEALFGLMKDDAGEPITIVPTILLVPTGKKPTANRLINSAQMPNTSASTIGFNQENDWFKRVKVLSSSYLTVVNAGDWYLGDFKRQFLEKVVFPLQVLTRSDEKNEAAWERDVVAQYKVRRASTFGAVDYRYVVQGNV